MFKHAAAGARNRWPILVLSLVSVSALTLSAFTLVASAGKGRHLTAVLDNAVSNVPIGKADAVDAALGTCTCSPNFHDMADMTKTFKLGGRISQPVIVLFQGNFDSTTQGSSALIRLTIDGIPQSSPGQYGIAVPARMASPVLHESGTHGFNFISSPLTPGTHTATIQFADSSEGPWEVYDRSMIILHK